MATHSTREPLRGPRSYYPASGIILRQSSFGNSVRLTQRPQVIRQYKNVWKKGGKQTYGNVLCKIFMIFMKIIWNSVCLNEPRQKRNMQKEVHLCYSKTFHFDLFFKIMRYVDIYVGGVHKCGKTSQELQMLSSVTFYCHITLI